MANKPIFKRDDAQYPPKELRLVPEAEGSRTTIRKKLAVLTMIRILHWKGVKDMADTGEDREIKQRVNAHQKEVVREMKALLQTANMRSARDKGAKLRHKPAKPKSRMPRG